MNIVRVAGTVLGAAALCGLLVSAGCNGALSSNNSSGQPSGGTPVPSVTAPGDWGMSMLAGGSVGIGMFPAKFTFDVNAPVTNPSSCANDFVGFNTSLAGVSPTAAATQTGTWTGAVANSGTVTITSTEATLVLTASTTVNTGLNFQLITDTTTEAANLAAAINRSNFATLGADHVKVRATSSGATITVAASADGITNLNGSEGNFITLTQTILPAGRFSWTGAALTGGLGTGNIVAFNNLYSTQGSVGGLCNHDGPSVMWSYYTGTGTVVTSIVLSGDGSKVAFVENVGGAAWLRILKWKAGEGAATGYPVHVDQDISGTNWSTCTVGNSCIASIPFITGHPDTKSSPFYVYRNSADVLYAGDDNGRVHKFTGVFNGTPAEVTVSWPRTINGATKLTSPIYDSISGNIFVGDSTGLLSMIREVGSAPGAGTCMPQPCVEPIHLAVGTGGGIVDAPIVDGTTGRVFAVNGTETSANNGTILQASTALTGAVSFKIGGTSTTTPSPIYSGAFDNTYITSLAGNTLGHMYVCGKDPGNKDRPAVYQLSFTALTGVLSGVGATPFQGLSQGDVEACSPITEFFNSTTATDWIFFSIGTNLAGGGSPLPAVCQGGGKGCVLSVNVTGSPTWPPAAPSNGAPTPPNAAGATSGFVVDNVSASAQAASFYFTLGANSTGAGPGLPSCHTTAGVGCAVKLTQSALN